jgi:hypothetical protein
MKHEYTSEEIASLASRGLHLGKDALTDHEFRRVCGSDLTQARPHQRLINAMMPPPSTPYEHQMWRCATPPNALGPDGGAPTCALCGHPQLKPTLAHYLMFSEHFDATLR